MKTPQLRVCLTDACDKQCFYCRSSGESSEPRSEGGIVSADQFIYLINAIVESGVRVVRLTGGEPMLHSDVYKIISVVRKNGGVEHLSIVTRSRHLKQQAKRLQDSGIDSITVSLDSLDRENLARITQVDILNSLKEGIEECYNIGLPITLNTVLMKGINEHEIEEFLDYVDSLPGTCWKILDYMMLPGDGNDCLTNRYYLRPSTIVSRISARSVGSYIRYQEGGLGIPMEEFKLASGSSVVVKDSTVGNHYCHNCFDCSYFPCQDGIMALRLTSRGRLQRCLYRHDNLIDLSPNVGLLQEEELKQQIKKQLRLFQNSIFLRGTWRPIECDEK